MNKHLYDKMALTNIRKNGKLYIPYLLSTIGSLMFFYILISVGSNPAIYNLNTGAEAFKGAASLCSILQGGSFVTSVFALIFLLYANSFVLKSQKKQLGLYRVLGMERKHIVRIIMTEGLFIFVIGLLLALFFGFLFDKLMLVLLFKIIGKTAPAGFYFNLNALLETVKLSLSITALILLRSMFSILSAKDIELLKSEKAGEREPKNRPLFTIIGLIFLGIGYYIALQSTGVSTAISNFMPASFLVMIATYMLFTTGSIFVLKLLKKNKNYYYNTKHFISISGMLYRMKQNAAGLATICILSTAAIVVLSAGAALYANGERSINEQFPRTVHFTTPTDSKDHAQELLEQTLDAQSFAAEDMLYCSYGNSLYTLTETGIEPIDRNQSVDLVASPDVFILTLEEYNRFNGTSVTLDKDEILLYASDDCYKNESLTFLGETYRIKGEADSNCLKYITNISMALFAKLLIITPDEATFQTFTANAGLAYIDTWFGFNSSQTDENIIAFSNVLSGVFDDNGLTFELYVRQLEEESFYSMYGGILFVGVALGILFILSTVMIIYYKQISEGYEDRERFLIMQKVGLSKEEIRKSIHSQIMLVFFLPLITAVIHAAVALKIVANCLRLVVIVHMPTFILSVAVTCVLFSIVYMAIYKITSKEYYNIVNE